MGFVEAMAEARDKAEAEAEARAEAEAQAKEAARAQHRRCYYHCRAEIAIWHASSFRRGDAGGGGAPPPETDDADDKDDGSNDLDVDAAVGQLKNCHCMKPGLLMAASLVPRSSRPRTSLPWNASKRNLGCHGNGATNATKARFCMEN